MLRCDRNRLQFIALLCICFVVVDVICRWKYIVEYVDGKFLQYCYAWNISVLQNSFHIRYFRSCSRSPLYEPDFDYIKAISSFLLAIDSAVYTKWTEFNIPHFNLNKNLKNSFMLAKFAQTLMRLGLYIPLESYFMHQCETVREKITETKITKTNSESPFAEANLNKY